MESASDTPVTIPLRRATLEVLQVRNLWEARWTAFINRRKTNDAESHPQPALSMDVRRFRLWMLMASDAEVTESYRKWGCSPEEHVEAEFQRATEREAV